MDNKKEPVIVSKRAIDVTPHHHGIWCRVADSRLFVNPIVHRKWTEDGQSIVFMLDTHNFLFAKPEEEIDVVETEPMYRSQKLMEDCDQRDAETMAKRPVPKQGSPEIEALKAELERTQQRLKESERAVEALQAELNRSR